MVDGAREVTAQSMVTAEEVLSLAQRQSGYDGIHVKALHDYACQLESAGLPIIFDYEHLSRLSRFKSHFLFSVANSPSYFYHTFKIKKRTGGLRLINEPLPDLKFSNGGF